MARQSAKVQQMDLAAIRIRLNDAQRFLEAATLFVAADDIASLKVAGSNAVNAGIAAADVICGSKLGYCSQSTRHQDAIALLERAVPNTRYPKDLAALLSDKSDYQYGSTAVRKTAAQL